MEKIIEFWNENKTKIVASVIFLFVMIFIFWGIYFFNTMKAKADSVEYDDTNQNSITKTKEVKTDNIKIKVDIKGYIKKPGVYELNDSDRVLDVITKAGGLKEGADTSSINLSKKIYDEMVIIIYSSNEVKNISDTKKNESQKNADCKNNGGKIENGACIDNNTNNASKSSASTDTQSKTQSKVNINTASLDELEKLSGIGEAKARSIIDYRSENGNFSKIEDIKNVRGIGDSLFEKIKNNITT